MSPTTPPTPPLQQFKKTLSITNSTYKGLQWTPLVKMEKEFGFSKCMSPTTPPLHQCTKTIRHHKLQLQRTPMDSIGKNLNKFYL